MMLNLIISCEHATLKIKVIPKLVLSIDSQYCQLILEVSEDHVRTLTTAPTAVEIASGNI